MNILINILCSFLGSVILVLISFYVYYKLSQYYSKKTICSDCYWIPKFKCWKFMIKNFSSHETFYNIKYSSWISKVDPSSPFMVSYIRDELSNGERSIISVFDNIPVICFRIEKINNQFTFFLTDQFGNTIKKYSDIIEYDFINIEYQLKIIKLGFVKFEINRQYSIPTNNKFDSCLDHVPNIIDYMKYQENKEIRKNFFSKQAEIFSTNG